MSVGEGAEGIGVAVSSCKGGRLGGPARAGTKVSCNEPGSARESSKGNLSLWSNKHAENSDLGAGNPAP